MDELSIEIKDATRDIIKELVIFYKSYFKDDNRIFMDGYLEWLLISNPNGRGKCVTVQVNKDVIANMFLIPIKIKVGNHVRCGYFAAEVLSHPEHRSKNLFVKMIRTSIQYLNNTRSFILGHPNDMSTPGWKRTKMNFVPSYRSYLSKPNLHLFKVTAVKIKHQDDLFLINDEVNRILNNSNGSIIMSDCKFIYWKYILNPTKRYTINAIYVDDILRGIVISYKYKMMIDRVVHYIIDDGFEDAVFKSSIIPRVFSFPQTDDFAKYAGCFYKKSIGSEIKFFFTDYGVLDETINPSSITFAACDN